MSGSVNKVILVGNLGKDPEIRNTQNGKKVITLSVATSESWRDKVTGEKRDRTEWHRVIVFDERLAVVAESYLKKGTKIFLEGRLQTRKWLDNRGRESFTTEIVLPRYCGEITILSNQDNVVSHVGGETFETKNDKTSKSEYEWNMDYDMGFDGFI